MNFGIASLWLIPVAIDMRLGIDGLSLWIQQHVGQSPCAGQVWLFSNKRRNRIKALYWDNNGVWLCQRRLHRGTFTWMPRNTATTSTAASTATTTAATASTGNPASIVLTQAQWQYLINGLDWSRADVEPNKHWQL